jgi:hypothetical protein
MEHFLGEPDHQQLVDLLFDGPAIFLVESTEMLPHRSSVSSDVQGVLGDFPRYARHVQGTPCEYFGIRAEKVDKHCFLFGLKLRADP